MPDARRFGVIDSNRQNLPVPLGGMTPVRMHRARRRQPIRSHAQVAAAVIGLFCAASGVALFLLPTVVAVSMADGRIHVGSMILTEVRSIPATSTTLYGGDASYALAEPGDGSARAAAAWMSSGTLWSGMCDLHRNGVRLVEECSFMGAFGEITSVDTLDPADGSTWRRTYADGVHVTIAVAPDAAAIPVPFPIGR